MKRLRIGLLVTILVAGSVLAQPGVSLAATGHLTGTLADGGQWVADVPASWNGVLLIFSHGFGPPIAQDAPDPATLDALLARGYALAGSSYDPNGSWWALQSAVHDEFETVDIMSSSVLPHRPGTVLAFGQSMGGLVSALEAQVGQGHIDGALTTCGIVAGGIDLNQYQLAAEYTLEHLLAPNASIPLVRFGSPGDGGASGGALTAIATAAQATPAGRARLALALALFNAPPMAPGMPTASPNDPDAFEAAQFASQFEGAPTIPVFIQFARFYIEESAGGNTSFTRGLNFAQLLHHSPDQAVVEALYREAGLDLGADLASLTADANIDADPASIPSLVASSVPTGTLEVPELDLHTIGDQLVPVPMENAYAATVRRAGSQMLLRQAFVDRFGHCAFTPAELVAGVQAIRRRVDTGVWGDVAQPQSLEASALGLGLGDAAFVAYQPNPISGIPGPWNVAADAR